MAGDDFRGGMVMPTLITQLRSILEQYPDDGQILKEIIQNAEDAGATKVIFLMDHDSYGKDQNKLHHPDLDKYQGPALYTYNNVTFNERDWEGIRRLYDSIKANDPLKVGRFGLGFKSVFHMTDLPSIYSGYNIGFLDPHKRYFSVPVRGQSMPEKTSSFNWNFQVKEHIDEIHRFDHQFQPYIQNLFGVTKEVFRSGFFNGTMMRFPLRNEDMYSDLSQNHYDSDKILNLMKFLEVESEVIFMFLRNVKHIEFYEKRNGSPIKLLEIKIPSEYQQMVYIKRCELSTHIESNAVEWYRKESLTKSYFMEVEVTDANGSKKTSSWLVTQHFGGLSCKPTADQSIDGYLPLVGVASKWFDDCTVVNDVEPYGQLFCFMPLPLEEKSPTGFYFHVHGSFAVDQNRRHLKWRSADQDPSKISDKDLIWNKFLIENLLPICLMNHIKSLIEKHKMLLQKETNSDFLQKIALDIYSIFPNNAIVNHRWTNFVSEFVSTVISSIELYSITTMQWKKSMPHILTRESGGVVELQKRILREDKKDLACLPLFVQNVIPRHTSNHVSADEICRSYRNVQNVIYCSNNEKILLLKHFMENLQDIENLIGINLLPLCDDSWIPFEGKSGKCILVTNEDFNIDLFPMYKNLLLSLDRVPKNLINRFTAHFNILNIDKRFFAVIMKWAFHAFEADRIDLMSRYWLDEKWLKRVWKCINREFKNSLDDFLGLHLLLVNKKQLVRLTTKPTIIGSPTNVDIRFIEICHKLKIEFVYTYNNDIYIHRCLWNQTILLPGYKNLLKFMMAITGEEQLTRFDTLNDIEKDFFCDNLAIEISSNPLTTDEYNFLRKLKMFKTINGSGKQPMHFVSLNEVNETFKDHSSLIPPVSSFIKLIDISNESSRKLATSLSVNLLDYRNLLEKAFIPGVLNRFYNNDEIQILMKHVCNNIDLLSSNAQHLLSTIPFVQKSDGMTLARACDFFDNNEEILRILFDTTYFPNESWRKPQFYDALKKLRMKSSNLISVNDCVHIVSDLANNSDNENSQKYDTFLRFLNSNRSLLTESFKNQIKQFNWIKIKKVKPHRYPSQLKYLGQEIDLSHVRIDDVISYKYDKIVGSTCLMMDSKSIDALEKFFGWDQCPPLDKVVQHLKNVITSFSGDDYVLLPDYLKEIYGHLNNYSKNDLEKVLHRDFQWVFINKKFVSPNFVVKTAQRINAEPYIYILPQHFQQFSILWDSLNVSETPDFVQVLAMIKEYHDITDCKNQERAIHDLNLAIAILNHIADAKESLSNSGNIFVPIKTNDESIIEMELIYNCVYCDKSWYQNGFELDDLDDCMRLIHDKIPMRTAEKLNIASCLSKMLNVEEFYINWGQQESITTRLNNILKDYTDGLSVLKELIQNADDAGATEVNFVFDERMNEHARTILLSEGMKDLQGPAIWCHNNAVFTDSDFENITKLGAATKETSTTKIGKFGLGFNSVYNLTDVPIIVSNDSIVIFDPHERYLGKALIKSGSPGIKLKLTGNHKIKKLKDQFEPFNGMFECDFSQKEELKKYNGTLFRFPLRTKFQAQNSKICRKHYNRNEVIQLFDCLTKVKGDLIMFAQSVCKINLYHIEEGSYGPNLSNIFNISRKVKEIIINVPGVMNFSYLRAVLPLISNKNRNSHEYTMIVELKTSHNKNSFLDNLLEDDNKIEHWCVSWCCGTEESLEMFTRNNNSLPIGAVSARLHYADSGRLVLEPLKEGKMFCFLPLPVKHFLPLHINGYFAMNSSRTHMCTRIENDKVDSRWIWNEALLKDSITLAFCNLLKFLAAQTEANLYHVLPGIDEWKNNSLWVESVYKKIFQTKQKVFRSFVNGQVYSFDECRILGEELLSKRFSQAIEIAIKAVSAASNTPVLILPPKISTLLLDIITFNSYVILKVITMKEFYDDWFVPNLRKINVKERDEIIIETVIDPNLSKFLFEKKCIPVTPGGENFKSIHELIHPMSNVGKLYIEEEEMFPFVSEQFEKYKSPFFDKLNSFGMRNETITKKETVDRCHSVERNPETVQIRLPILLKLMQDHFCDSPLSAEDLKLIGTVGSIKMFPSKEKPTSFPLLWKQEKFTLISCNEGYLEDKMFIAGPSFAIIDEEQSFKQRFKGVKKVLKIHDKSLTTESCIFLLKEFEKHFDENNSYLMKNSYFEEYLIKIIEEFYKELDQMNKKKLLNSDISRSLKKMKCILSDTRPFCLLSSNQCCEFIHKSLMPYLCGVNETTLKKFKSIWPMFDIRNTFTVDEYVTVLNRIGEKCRGQILDAKPLNLVIDALECISDSLKSEESKEIATFLMPNKEGLLCPSSQLKYDDCEWSKFPDSEYCHDKISKELAKNLGIKTSREIYISDNDLCYPFGQREELVDRINRILSGYPMEECFFKEIIQNADDALASEVHFICDSRHLPTNKVFCDNWSLLQGPAMCIYNDKSFSTNDLDGIQKLGKGSKQYDMSKTGQYGVGFNCVYHLTDVPSFMTTIIDDKKVDTKISGTVLGIFDPNCYYLPNVRSSCPGAIYKSDIVTKCFTDVYSGYLQNIDKYNVSKSGTIFRLPLRNHTSKLITKINGKISNVDDIKNMFSLFGEELHSVLLFLKSIESIHLVDIASNEKLNVLRVAKLHLTDENKDKREKYSKFVNETVKMLQDRKVSLKEILCKEVLYEVEVEDSKCKSSTWILVQRFGFRDCSEISSETLNGCSLALQPCGGIAFCLDSFCSDYKMPKGRIFNFLPLPRGSNLPVHINGHFFLAGENRRDLWSGETRTINDHWNEAIISQIIVPAFCSLLKFMKEKISREKNHEFPKRLKRYYELFPKHETWHPLKILTTELYKSIYDQKLDLLFVYNPDNCNKMEWTHIGEEVYFDDIASDVTKIYRPLKMTCDSYQFHSEADKSLRKKERFLRDILHSCGMKIIDGPFELWNKFEKAGVNNVKKITPESVRLHLKSSSFFNDFPKNIEDSPFNSVNGLVSILKYILSDVEDYSQLEDLPILLDANNVLRKMSSGIYLYESKYKDVAPHKLDCFINCSTESLFNNNIKKQFLKPLTISDLANLLGDNQNPFLSQDIEFIEGSEYKIWLKAVWKFISNVLENENDLIPIENLHLIPVASDGYNSVYPLNKRLCVLRPLDVQDESSKKLFESLKTAGVPILNVTFFNDVNTDKILRLFSNINNPVNLLRVLEEVYINRNLNHEINHDMGTSILFHFSQNITALARMSNADAILRSLPFYIDVNMRQVSLKGKNVFVIPKEIPPFDTEILLGLQIFLKSNGLLNEIYNFLKVSILSSHEVYMKFLFDAFSKLNPDSQLEHLKVIMQLLKSHSQDFVDRLKTFEFVNCDGCLRAASYFFKAKEIFILMNERFLPDPFHRKNWEEFCKTCGLITELSKEKFLEYAHKMSSLENTTRIQIIMIEWLNSYRMSSVNDEFLKTLKSIPFLSPSKQYSSLSKLFSFYGSSKYIPFENSVIHKNIRLSWTVSNILPEEVQEMNGDLFKSLNVISKLDSDLVLKNLINISVGFENYIRANKILTDDFKELIRSLTDEHLTWFGPNINKEKQALLKNLKVVKCLYVDDLKTMVRPNQIATEINSDEQIFPYIFRLPLFYGKHEQLLTLLGATKTITVAQCAKSLKTLKKEVQDKKMNPNQSNISKKLFNKLLQIFEKQKFCNLKKLFLPCEGGLLCDSSKIYCTDNYDFNRMAKKLDRPVIICNKIDLLLNLPEDIRPTHLDQLVCEKILKLGDDADITLAKELEKKFNDSNFIDGLSRLKLHDSMTRGENFSEEEIESMIEHLKSKLKNIHIFSKTKIIIQSLLRGVVVENSEKEVSFFVNYDSLDDSMNIYITSKVNHDVFMTTLSLHLASYCDIPKSQSLLYIIFNADSESIDFMLTEFKVTPLHCDIKTPLGNEIPIEDHFTLVQDVIILYPGQLVAYEISDPLDNSLEQDSESQPKYILVQIVKPLEDTECVSIFKMKYQVNCGNYEDTVCSTKLFAFKTKVDDSTAIMLSGINHEPEYDTIRPLTTLPEIIEIMKCSLKEIWNLEVSERKRAIRRLFLKFHPDKNPDQEQLYDEAFKYLKIFINKLEAGLPIDDCENKPDEYCFNFNFSSNSYPSGFDQNFFEHINRRARSHNYSEKHKCGTGYRKYSSNSSRSCRQFFRDFSKKRRNDPMRAELFMSQAFHDLEAALNDASPNGLKSPQWRCIKYYQVVKNGIMGVCASKDADRMPVISKTLKDMCSEIYDEELDSLVQEVDDHLISTEHLTQPSSALGRAAFQVITEDTADAVSRLVEKVMARCSKLLKMYNNY